MAVTKAQQKAVSKYVKNNYDRIEVKVTKGKKSIIEDVASKHGESINGYTKKPYKQKLRLIQVKTLNCNSLCIKIPCKSCRSCRVFAYRLKIERKQMFCSGNREVI